MEKLFIKMEVKTALDMLSKIFINNKTKGAKAPFVYLSILSPYHLSGPYMKGQTVKAAPGIGVQLLAS